MGAALSPEVLAAPRAIALRTRGHTRGPITRLVSPSDLGALIKPFVFLDLFETRADGGPRFGFHPHSGIATLTVLLQGRTRYEESGGAQGELQAGDVEWMQAGNGIWHTATPVGEAPLRGFQLWVALPPELENAPHHSHYAHADEVPRVGPARVVLGRLGEAQSPIAAPSDMCYLSVELKPGERWRYQPPAGHTVGWIALHAGAVQTSEAVTSGELAVFAPGEQAIDIEAGPEGAGFVLGSAVPHPHPLVMGYYSVHTSADALARGEAEIERIGQQLQAQGRLR